ncbi:hypothetical protein PG995_005186 [Apiospora arundinis]
MSTARLREVSGRVCMLYDKYGGGNELLGRQDWFDTLRMLDRSLQDVLKSLKTPEESIESVQESAQHADEDLQPFEEPVRPEKSAQPEKAAQSGHEDPQFTQESKKPSDESSQPEKATQPPVLKPALKRLLNKTSAINAPNCTSHIPKWRNDPEIFFLPAQVQCMALRPTDFSVSSFLWGHTQSQGLDPKSESLMHIASTQQRLRMIGMWMLKTIHDTMEISRDQASLLSNDLPSISGKGYTKLADRGRQYCEFITDFGDSDVVFGVSDKDIPRSTFEVWPLAAKREELIKALKKRGILKAAKEFNGLTDVLLKFLYEKVKEYAFVHVSESSSRKRKRRSTQRDIAMETTAHPKTQHRVDLSTWETWRAKWLAPTESTPKTAVDVRGSAGNRVSVSQADHAFGSERDTPTPPTAATILEIPDEPGRGDVPHLADAQSLLQLATSGSNAPLSSTVAQSQSIHATGNYAQTPLRAETPDPFDIERYIYVNRPMFVPLSKDLEELWKGTWRLDWNGCPKRQFKREGLVAYKAVPFPTELNDLALGVGQFIHPVLERQVKQRLRFNSVALSLKSGAMKDEYKARISIVIHLMRTESDRSLPCFARNRTDEVFYSHDRKHLAIIEEDMCITKEEDEDEERFIWIRDLSEIRLNRRRMAIDLDQNKRTRNQEIA